MSEWSKLVPADAPKRVEEARRAVEQLRAKIPEQRKALDAARAAITEAEAADRQRMAEELRRGGAVQADAESVAKAQARVASVQREGEALLLAVQLREDELGEAARKARGEWAKTAERRERDARQAARAAFEQLRVALEGLRLSRSTLAWLTPSTGGLDREMAPRLGSLGAAQSSAFAMANASPVAAEQLLQWVGELIDPPKPQTMPQPSPLQPVSLG